MLNTIIHLSQSQLSSGVCTLFNLALWNLAGKVVPQAREEGTVWSNGVDLLLDKFLGKDCRMEALENELPNVLRDAFEFLVEFW